MSKEPVSVRAPFEQLVVDIRQHLDEVEGELDGVPITTEYLSLAQAPDGYWEHLSEKAQERARGLVQRLLVWAGGFTPLLKSAPLASESDQRDLMLAVKTIRSALMLRHFRHYDADVLHDEDVVLGVTPARQSDDEVLAPHEAKRLAAIWSDTILRSVELVEASINLGDVRGTASARVPTAARYRPDTAFILMWMDKSKPELEDVADAVKQVFGSFGIRAVRADDIEHEGLITQRVLDEIATSEFLFADLTGERPNVYYEVGYAHALQKRVMLFRKAGTSLHFDLAGYNCPAYDNLIDLKEKIKRRLTDVTNRKPRD